MYNPNNDIWTEICELNEGRKFSSGCSLGFKIYVFGGSFSDAAETSVESYEASQYLNGNNTISW